MSRNTLVWHSGVSLFRRGEGMWQLMNVRHDLLCSTVSKQGVSGLSFFIIISTTALVGHWLPSRLSSSLLCPVLLLSSLLTPITTLSKHLVYDCPFLLLENYVCIYSQSWLTMYVENCAPLGYYHYLLHNNPEERSCHLHGGNLKSWLHVVHGMKGHGYFIVFVMWH